jgi:hypothetical protein
VNISKALKNIAGLLITLKLFVHNFITYRDILCTNFNIFNNPSVFLHALLVFTNSVKMIKVEGNMSDL